MGRHLVSEDQRLTSPLFLLNVQMTPSKELMQFKTQPAINCALDKSQPSYGAFH